MTSTQLTCAFEADLVVLQVEIQSEYWVSIQVTLFIVVIHYRVQTDEGFELVSESHVCVSSDLHHDTHFVQHFMPSLAEHLKARGLEFDIWNINTDGAPSHFKNKSTFFSLFDFKEKAGASEVMWETCAPGPKLFCFVVQFKSLCGVSSKLNVVSGHFLLLTHLLLSVLSFGHWIPWCRPWQGTLGWHRRSHQATPAAAGSAREGDCSGCPTGFRRPDAAREAVAEGYLVPLQAFCLVLPLHPRRRRVRGSG